MPPHRPQRTAIPTSPNNIPIHPLQRALSEAIAEYNRVAADCQAFIHRIDSTHVHPRPLHVNQPLLAPPISEAEIQRSVAWFAEEIGRLKELTEFFERVREVARGVVVRLGC